MTGPGSARAARPPRMPRAAAPWWHGALLVALMLATLPLVNPHIRSDGNEYYAYVRSVVIDGDLHFDNEFARGEATFRGLLTGELHPLPTGYVRNYGSVGPSLMWTPFFLAGHAIAHVLSASGKPVAPDGYSWPYLWCSAGGTALYTFLGLWLAYRMALRFASPGAAWLATLAIWLASSLPVYLYFLPFHAHAVASFTAAWFLWNWLHVRDGGGRWRWAVWGISAGLVAAVHYLNGLLLIVALVEVLTRMVRPRLFIETVGRSLIFAAGCALVLLPGVVIRWIIEGSPFATGYGPSLFYWRDPRLLAVAFSPEHGALLWTPVLLLAFAGLVWLIRRSPAVGVMVTIQAGVLYYAVASYLAWHGHSSYGNRFLTALTPVFILGLAALIDRCVGTGGRVGRWAAAWAVVTILIAWNAGFMFQWGTNLVPNRGPVDMRVVARNQVTIVPRQVWRFVERYLLDRSAVNRGVEGDLRDRPPYTIKR